MKARKYIPKKEEVLEYFSYDEVQGTFIRIKKSIGSDPIGSLAGKSKTNGYPVIRINGRNYYCHHLAWLIHHQEWPSMNIDHINGNREDFRISNLRLVDNSQNQFNTKTPITNKTGVKGVCIRIYGEKKYWEAQIGIRGKSFSKQFKNFDDAVSWRKSKEIELHGEFRRK